jgi:hypothetical protein
MKIKKIIPGAGVMILIACFLCSFQYKQISTAGSADVKPTPGFPEEIMKIITNSCYDCHSGESQNQIAKTVMDFYKWNEYKTSKQINLLTKIGEVISEKSMPPKKYLDKNPEKSLTEEQIKMFSKWAEEESSKLTK